MIGWPNVCLGALMKVMTIFGTRPEAIKIVPVNQSPTGGRKIATTTSYRVTASIAKCWFTATPTKRWRLEGVGA
jgi:hypothetical protein